MPARRLLSPARAIPIVAASIVLTGVLGTATASADIAWAPCSTAGYQCGHLDVPLNRAGAVPGTVSLAAQRVQATSNPSRVAVVPLAGGPGQAALPLAQTFAAVLQPALASRDLLIFDQRGTGSWGRVDCQSLHERGTVVKLSAACANELGAGRGSYRTSDTVEDIEALRVAGGYDKLVLFGVSYGTKVAEDYAAAHPDHVEALVLDSVVLPEGPDPFRRSSMASVPRVLTDLCRGGACRRATPSVRRDLTTLPARRGKHAVRGPVVDSTGTRQSASLGQSGLFGI